MNKTIIKYEMILEKLSPDQMELYKERVLEVIRKNDILQGGVISFCNIIADVFFDDGEETRSLDEISFDEIRNFNQVKIYKDN